MSVIPYWNMLDHELVNEALRSDNELLRELGERFDALPNNIEELEKQVSDLDTLSADALAAVADLYNAGGFPKGGDASVQWDGEDNELLDYLDQGREHIGYAATAFDTLTDEINVFFSRVVGPPPSVGATTQDLLRQLQAFFDKKTADFETRLAQAAADHAALERLVASLTDTIATKDRHIAELQKTPIEEKEPAMSLETRMESLENRMVSLEGSNTTLVDAIERLIAVMSAGPVPTATAARTRKTANTNKKEDPTSVVEPVTETATAATASAQPEPSRPASTEISQGEVIDALSRLPREQAFAIVSAHSSTKKLSGVPAEKYAVVLAACAAAAGQEAA